MVKVMALDLSKLWEVLDKLLEAGNDFVENQAEAAYGAFHAVLVAKVEATTTPFDNNGLKTVELAVRDKLIKIYPLDEYPLD